MKDVHVVGSKMTRNDGKLAKLIGCAFHFETEFFLAAYPASNDFIFVFARETMKKKITDQKTNFFAKPDVSKPSRSFLLLPGRTGAGFVII